ncbi:MAG: phosphotransferase, partial [Solirubrobacteraceae bacterium]
MISIDTYLQPDAPDPVLSVNSVLHIARRHAPWLTAVAEVDESGGEARAYMLHPDAVLKTQRPQQLRPRTSLAKEALILEHLAQKATVSVPRLLGYGHDGAVEYVLMSRMPGVAMRHVPLTRGVRSAVLRDLGRALRQLHDVDQAQLVSSGLIPGDN